MNRNKARKVLGAAALLLGLAGAGLGARPVSPSDASSTIAPATIEPFELAALLSESPPEVVVITLDEPKHPMNGAMPAASFGTSDDDLVAAAPKVRRIVLAGGDAVRVDRVARRLIAEGRNVTVLAGGFEAWDKAMDSDPAAPAPTAGAEAWKQHNRKVALRRYFGDASAAPAAPVRAPSLPVVSQPSAGKKREGC